MTEVARIDEKSGSPVVKCDDLNNSIEKPENSNTDEKIESLDKEDSCTQADYISADTYFHSIFGADTPDWTKIVVKTEKDTEPENTKCKMGLTNNKLDSEITIKKEGMTSSSSSDSIQGQRPAVFLSQKAYEQYQALLKTKIKCPNCFFTTCNRGNLKQHMKKHEKPAGHVYTCDICDFKTKYKNSMKGHIARHENREQGSSNRKK